MSCEYTDTAGRADRREGRWSVLELEIDGYPGGHITVSLATEDGP